VTPLDHDISKLLKYAKGLGVKVLTKYGPSKVAGGYTEPDKTIRIYHKKSDAKYSLGFSYEANFKQRGKG